MPASNIDNGLLQHGKFDLPIFELAAKPLKHFCRVPFSLEDYNKVWVGNVSEVDCGQARGQRVDCKLTLCRPQLSEPVTYRAPLMSECEVRVDMDMQARMIREWAHLSFSHTQAQVSYKSIGDGLNRQAHDRWDSGSRPTDFDSSRAERKCLSV